MSHEEDENNRIQALRGYDLLDTPPEAEFDSLVAEAANLFSVPIALMSLVDENRQWFKAASGLDAKETPRSVSFCAHAICSDEIFSVSDTKNDPRFADNPLVTGEPNIRFYAGAPLQTLQGERIGTICIIDRKPHTNFSNKEEHLLRSLASRAMETLERRKLLLNSDMRH